MSYHVTGIADLAEYHLVACAPDDEAAHANLVQLVGRLEAMAPGPLWREVTWVFCDRCGCSVDTDLIHPETHRYSDDGDFYCADCWAEL